MGKIIYDLITVLGPTASGKTRFAAVLAYNLNGEIISADSRQVYCRMDIGTGKDYDDYTVKDKKIPFHLIDILEPGDKFNVYEYQQYFLKAYNEIKARNNIPVLCGGSGLYIEAVTKGYRLLPVPPDLQLRKKLEVKSLEELTKMLSSYKKLHNITDVDTKKRAVRAIEIEQYYRKHPEIKKEYPDINNIYIGINPDRTARREKITARLQDRLKGGMVEEVKSLLEEGIKPDDLIYYGLEYKYITHYIIGETDYDTMVNKLNISIHRFAKRQMTWFRKMERSGASIHWLDANMPLEEKVSRALKLIIS